MPRFSPLKIKALFKGSIGGLGVNKTWGVGWVKKTLLLKEGSHMKGV